MRGAADARACQRSGRYARVGGRRASSTGGCVGGEDGRRMHSQGSPAHAARACACACVHGGHAPASIAVSSSGNRKARVPGATPGCSTAGLAATTAVRPSAPCASSDLSFSTSMFSGSAAPQKPTSTCSRPRVASTFRCRAATVVVSGLVWAGRSTTVVIPPAAAACVPTRSPRTTCCRPRATRRGVLRRRDLANDLVVPYTSMARLRTWAYAVASSLVHGHAAAMRPSALICTAAAASSRPRMTRGAHITRGSKWHGGVTVGRGAEGDEATMRTRRVAHMMKASATTPSTPCRHRRRVGTPRDADPDHILAPGARSTPPSRRAVVCGVCLFVPVWVKICV